MTDELSLLQAQLTYKKRLEAMQKELCSQRDALQTKVTELKKIMVSEQKDVDRLQSPSLAAFFYYATGKIHEKLDEERREAYAARIKYDAALRELKAIEQDIEATEEDLQDLAHCETRYAQVIEEKRIAIESAGTPLSQELLDRERELTFLTSQERELEEAIAAGTAALRSANDVVISLKNAEGIGSIDFLPGSGFLADMAKHESLDEAQKTAEDMQVLLHRFNKELADVELRSELQVSIERLLKFSDFFFDHLLTDDTVFENIKKSHTQVDQARDLILGILRQLQNRLETVRHRQLKLKNDVNLLIVNHEP